MEDEKITISKSEFMNLYEIKLQAERILRYDNVHDFMVEASKENLKPLIKKYNENY